MARKNGRNTNGAPLGFEMALSCPMEALSRPFAESKRLKDEIRKNLKEMGFDV